MEEYKREDESRLPASPENLHMDSLNTNTGYHDKMILKSIKEFVGCLCDVFTPKRQTPLGRYKRLIQYVKHTDTACQKFFEGYKIFFSRNSGLLSEKNIRDMDRRTIIPYSSHIYIPIGAFLGTTESQIILRHLLLIRALLLGEEDCKDCDVSAENLNDDCDFFPEKSEKEGKGKEKELVSELLKGIEDGVGDIKAESPTEAIKQLLSSGTFENMIGKIQRDVESGHIDGMNLAKEMQRAIPRLISKAMTNGEDISQLTPLLQGLNFQM